MEAECEERLGLAGVKLYRVPSVDSILVLMSFITKWLTSGNRNCAAFHSLLGLLFPETLLLPS